MKTITTILLILVGQIAYSQNQIDQQFDASSSEKIILRFKYPELIKITAWDKNEVLIKGTVNINNGTNNDSFKLKQTTEGGELVIYSEIEGIDDLPKTITIKKEGTIYSFNTDNWNDPEVQKFIQENDGTHEYMSHGVYKEIKLEVFVPRKKAIEVEAKYGLVEVSGIEAPLKVIAKYGGIDINISNSSRSNVEARTKYGEIYTDLDAQFDQTGNGVIDYNKWTIISAKLNGGGVNYDIESKYGNIYMRKQ